MSDGWVGSSPRTRNERWVQVVVCPNKGSKGIVPHEATVIRVTQLLGAQDVNKVQGIVLAPPLPAALGLDYQGCQGSSVIRKPALLQAGCF